MTNMYSRKTRTPWWRWAITGAIGMIAVAVVLSFWLGAPTGEPPAWARRMAASETPSFPTGVRDSALRAPDAGILSSLSRQRELARDLARRHVGARLRGDIEDLRVLQRILDRGVLGPDDSYELQALGVALGDVLADAYDLDWAVVTDRFGTSRALRYRDTSNLIFPVTMISKRVEADIPVDVQHLFDETGDALAGIVPGVGPADAREPLPELR